MKMKVIDYKVSTSSVHRSEAGLMPCGRAYSRDTWTRRVTVVYQDEHGHYQNEQMSIEIMVGANDSDEDILRQCEAAIQPPVDNHTLARKVRETVDKLFGVCK